MKVIFVLQCCFLMIFVCIDSIEYGYMKGLTEYTQCIFKSSDTSSIENLIFNQEFADLSQLYTKKFILYFAIIPFQVENSNLKFQDDQIQTLLFGILGMVFFCLFICYDNQNKRNITNSLVSNNEELKRINHRLSVEVHEKNILLKEIHHRVKNNLQLVMSLLNIQAQDSPHISIHEFLEKGRLRIATMSLIHQTLYQSENFENIDFQDYLESLVANIKDVYCANQVDIVVKTNGNTFDLDTLIPLGLIINELVCNSLKHAFPTDLNGEIYIAIQNKQDNVFELQVRDNGVGITNMVKKPKSIGLELVSLLVLQLQGKMDLINRSGTHFRIEFVNPVEN